MCFASAIRFRATTLWHGVYGVPDWFDGGYSGRVTPGPFPNPEAKTARADGTALGRVWESRSPPSLFVNKKSERDLFR